MRATDEEDYTSIMVSKVNRDKIKNIKEELNRDLLPDDLKENFRRRVRYNDVILFLLKLYDEHN